jgi:hypothetical protein
MSQEPCDDITRTRLETAAGASVRKKRNFASHLKNSLYGHPLPDQASQLPFREFRVPFQLRDTSMSDIFAAEEETLP